MKEYYVTPALAKKKIAKVKNAGVKLGLSKTFVNMASYAPGNRTQFGSYLKKYGVKYFSVKEIVTPKSKRKAKKAGYTELIPPVHLWAWSLLVLRVGDLMRKATGKPIKLRNLYRPMSYNKQVAKSGIKSDHPNACSGDFDFSTVSQRRVAEEVIRELSLSNPSLEISCGFGGRTLHVGVLSPKGKRSWFYNSYRDKKIRLK